jgi:hypothetical protein
MEKQASLIGNSPWLFSKNIDLFLLLLPVWLCWLACFALPESILQKDLPLWFWAVFILGIDVSHVWSTIFRTYLDKDEFSRHKSLLLYAPVISFIAFFALASISQMWFWRVLAYLALYHFIKQQYGFLALYHLKSGKNLHAKIFKDKWIIYFGMLYPVAYWHISGNRVFNWFIQHDFINIGEQITIYAQQLKPIVEQALPIFNVVYWLILVAWLVEEWLRTKSMNLPLQKGKILWIITTATNWYLGIVFFNSDIVFSLTNVVAHGIPYMVLVLYYVDRKKQIRQSTDTKTLTEKGLSIGLMLLLILFLAFGEEYLWDMLLYREKQPLFESLISYPIAAATNPFIQAIVLALLSIPQVSHYIIDGYIWKGKKNPYVKKVFVN